MSTLGFAVMVALSAVATYLTRWPPILMGRAWRPSKRIASSFEYIPIGVFAAMIAPAVAWHAPVDGHADVAFYVASAVSLAAAWRTKKPLWAMLAGVLTIAIWHAVQ